MKIPLLWLKDYVEIPENTVVLTDKLTSIGYMQDHRPETVGKSVVLDLEVRQNRSDCLSIIGIARETAAAFGISYKEPKITAKLPEVKGGVSVENEAPQQCYRFNTISFANITVKESPEWLKDRLTAYGIKTINNIVDITNFVMVEYGEPLHVFDLDSLAGKKLVVRTAKKGEQVTVLGGKKVALTPDDLVITDAQKIRGLAGVIGGLDEAVNEKTKNIVLEGATYNQASIRRTSLRHSIRTEASLRHEKFLDPTLSEVALRRAYDLIVELCGGAVIDHTDVHSKQSIQKNIKLSLNSIESLAGVVVTEHKAVSILQSLGMGVVSKQGALEVSVPYYRTDIEQEADLVEEVARIYGYDKIPEHLPERAVPEDIQSKLFDFEDKIRDVLIAAGMSEEITEPLAAEKSPEKDPVILQNSLNAEKTMLRTTLRHHIEHAGEVWKKHRFSSIALFEVGKIYYRLNKKYVEEKTLGGIFSGPDMSFRKVRGVVEYLFERLGRKYTHDLVSYTQLSEKEHTFYFQLSVEKLFKLPVIETVHVLTSVPHLIFEDMSIIIPAKVQIGNLIQSVRAVSSQIYSVTLGEDPRRMNNGESWSVFLKLAFGSEKGQIRTEEVVPIKQEIIQLLSKEFGAQLR